jgi:hypothetical protein
VLAGWVIKSMLKPVQTRDSGMGGPVAESGGRQGFPVFPRKSQTKSQPQSPGLAWLLTLLAARHRVTVAL